MTSSTTWKDYLNSFPKANRNLFETDTTVSEAIAEVKLTKAELLEKASYYFLQEDTETAKNILAQIPKSSECSCEGWGCLYCCTTLADIRSKQGTFG